MTETFKRFLALSDQDKRDVFESTASRLDTLPTYVEKDFWVCLVLDLLYNNLPKGHPNLLFKGGTSLSKGFGLIQRFSEDIDIVVNREDLGFIDGRDPITASDLSNKKRSALFDELNTVCNNYILGDLQDALKVLTAAMMDGCRVTPDEDDAEKQTLLIEYPTLFPSSDMAYVLPRLKIEGGERSARVPIKSCVVKPYIADDLDEFAFCVENITTISPKRTYWEKLLILHGAHCGFRDSQRLPADRDRVSRHYYDVAMITAADTGVAALSNHALLDAVRNHNLIAFRQAWKKFGEAVPGTVRLVPQSELHAVIETDYGAMQGMILGDAPGFGWVMEQLQIAEAKINQP